MKRRRGEEVEQAKSTTTVYEGRTSELRSEESNRLPCDSLFAVVGGSTKTEEKIRTLITLIKVASFVAVAVAVAVT